MLITRRTSTREAGNFPVGSHVIAKPVTFAKPLPGVVVDTWGPHTLVVRARGIEIAVDVEDCETP